MNNDKQIIEKKDHFTSPTLRDELIAFYTWKCKNNLFAGSFKETCETHESIVDKHLNSKSESKQ